MNFDLARMSLADIARALRDGTLRAAALVEACIEKRDPSLSAYREWQPELAREQAHKADAAFAQANAYNDEYDLALIDVALYETHVRVLQAYS